MSTPRIPPVPPEKEPDRTTPPTQHRKVGKVEKIEKVSEVDDETRARQFRQFVEADEEEPSSFPTPFSLFTTSEKAPTLPPPLTLQQKDPTLSQAAANAIPTPQSAPSPSAVLSNTARDDMKEEEPLPRSGSFWETVDDPSDMPPAPQPKMVEIPRSKERVFEGSSKGKEEKERVFEKPEKALLRESIKPKEIAPQKTPAEKKQLPSPEMAKNNGEGPFAPPLSTPPREEKQKEEAPFSSLSPTPREEKQKEEVPFSSLSPTPREEKQKEEAPFPSLSPTSREEKPKKMEGAPRELQEKNISPKKTESPLKEEGKPEKRPFQEKPERLEKPLAKEKKLPSLSKEHRETHLEKKQVVKDRLEKEGREKEGRKKEEIQTNLESPTLTPLPPQVIPIATAAAMAATPYLGVEALAIYYHMVGTIVAMVLPKGDSRTEFILNAPSFANSKFFGSTIAIERFSTAPYQLNIVLTGSNEAVALFNQNIPNLLAAFKNGNFSFAINRIEAVYRPLFHRKEAAKGKGFGEGFGTRKE